MVMNEGSIHTVLSPIQSEVISYGVEIAEHDCEHACDFALLEAEVMPPVMTLLVETQNIKLFIYISLF